MEAVIGTVITRGDVGWVTVAGDTIVAEGILESLISFLHALNRNIGINKKK